MKNGKLIKNIIVVVIVLVFAAILAYAAKTVIQFADDPESFRSWVNEKGMPGVFVIMGLAALQAIAVLPAGPVQVAAGYAFGAFWGTVYFLIGCTAGSMLVFMLVRRFGRRLVLLFFKEEKVRHIEEIINRSRWKRIFTVIFFIPGAPKDLITYCAGMTDIKPLVWLAICSFGRLPGILLSTLGGNAIQNMDYTIAAVFFGIAAVTTAVGFWVYKKNKF